MTNITPITDRLSELQERLRREHLTRPVLGGGSISTRGEASYYITDAGKSLVNPDGPAAAAEIETLLSDIAMLEARGKKAVEVIEPFASCYRAFAWADSGTPGVEPFKPDHRLIDVTHPRAHCVTVGDLRKAAAFLKDQEATHDQSA